MRVELNLAIDEVDKKLIKLIKTLLRRNAEVVIKKQAMTLSEYPADVSLDTVNGDVEIFSITNHYK